MAMPPDDPPPGVPEWVVTYGDMMSLLLTFFIMLVSMSTMKDTGRLRMMMDSFNQRFGSHDGQIGIPGLSLQRNSAYEKMASTGMTSQGGMKRNSRDAEGGGGPSDPARRIGHQQVPTLGAPVWFEGLGVELSPKNVADLDRLAAALKGLPNQIVIRGHTTAEPLPQTSPFADAWDLSFARADAVAARLIAAGIPGNRLVVSSAGDTEPRKRGFGEVQAENHRVDVFVVESYTTPPGTVR
ncbi:MAG: OmpA family protein [Planctomycetaceae bacterium]|nr:OmpA family protein [Planctomycetaceae bacterium]